MKRAGDNIYFKDAAGNWRTDPDGEIHHGDPASRAQDTKYSAVYIAKEYYYFGENSEEIPPWASALIRNGQSLKYTTDPSLVMRFQRWLRNSFSVGIHGEPMDREPLDGACKRRGRERSAPKAC
jgi:hypothetical protein